MLYENIITEDYLLSVDCDEYLYINNESLIDVVLKFKDVDSVYFQWVWCNSTNYSDLTPIDIIHNNVCMSHPGGKSLFKVNSIQSIYFNTHRPVLKRGKKKIVNKFNNYYILHFYTRNLYDPIIKCVIVTKQWLKQEENKLKIFLNNDPPFRTFPKRFQVLIIMDHYKYLEIPRIEPTIEYTFQHPFDYNMIRKMLVDIDFDHEKIVKKITINRSSNKKFMNIVRRYSTTTRPVVHRMCNSIND